MRFPAVVEGGAHAGPRTSPDWLRGEAGEWMRRVAATDGGDAMRAFR